jgi:fibronectin type 3 domain-containing protein
MKIRSWPWLLAAIFVLWLGTACSQKSQPHSVTLTWKAPSAASGLTIAGYNIYRSTVSGTQFVLLAKKVPGPPYEDHLVQSGRTYFYVVTTVDQTGRESRYSAETHASIP